MQKLYQIEEVNVRRAQYAPKYTYQVYAPHLKQWTLVEGKTIIGNARNLFHHWVRRGDLTFQIKEQLNSKENTHTYTPAEGKNREETDESVEEGKPSRIGMH